MRNMDENACQTLDLPWEDVLIPHILCHLPVGDIVSLQRVSKKFQTLIQLYLATCHNFDLSKVGTCISEKAFCTMLRKNNVLRNLSLRNSTELLTDGQLLPVIRQNECLLSVDMRGCARLTKYSLVPVAFSCPQLQHLSLAHCKWVDSLSLRSLIDHCGWALRYVDLTACRQLKDFAICYLARNCPRLYSLSVAGNINITNESVKEVARYCRVLKHLDLTSCLLVSNPSIRTLAEYCPHLHSLKVKHCRHVSETILELLRQRNVKIDVQPPLLRALTGH